MKNRLIVFKYSVRFFLLLIFVQPLLIGCTLTEDFSKIEDSLDGLKIVIATPSHNNTVFIDIKDQDGNFINDVQIKLSGTDARNLFDNTLKQTKDFNYSTTDGRFYFVLHPKISSTALAENNVKFNVTPIANGYLGLTQQVSVSGEKLKLITLKMLDKTANIGGVVQNKSTVLQTTATGQTVQQETVLNSHQASVTVEAQTVLTNSKNEPIKGTITSEISYFHPTDPISQALIAPSLAGEMVLKDGTTVTGQFVSGGLFNALLTSANDTVKSLTGSGLVFKGRVPSDLINPLTGNVIQEGEIIPMWSKDEGSGTWKYEKDAIFKRDNEGFYLKDTVNHLSQWNWDWKVNSCNKGPTFLWNFDGFKPEDKQIVVSIDAKYGVLSRSFDEYVSASNASTTLLNTPSNMSGTIRFSIKNQELGKKMFIEPASIDFSDLCTLGTKTINIFSGDDSAIEYYVKLNLDISSTDGKVTLKPSLWLDYSNTNKAGQTPPDSPNEKNFAKDFLSSGQIQVVNGKSKSTLAIIPETDCIIKTKIGNKTVWGKIRINYYGENKDQLQIVASPLSADAQESIILTTIPKPIRGGIIDIEYKADLASTELNMLKSIGFPLNSTE